MAPKNKKGHAGLIIFIIVLILAIGGGAGFYFYQRQQPQKAAEKFLDSMKNMDFSTMESMLQSSDLSALDNADIRNAAYTDFFTAINQKMTYKITKNRFDIQNGTASITAHITYVDGTDIYKATITEFLRQIVSNAYAGNQLTEEETQQRLASILNEKAAETETDAFSEADIVYPLIKTNSGWKIVSLDADTVKVMSANFTNVQDEINQSLAEMNNSENAGVEATVTPAETTSIDMDNDHFTLRLKEFRVTQAIDDSDCLLLYCDYTNNSSSSSSALVDVQLSAKQNGEKLSPAVPKEDEPAIDNYIAEVEPGSTVTVCYAFSLNDKSDVTLEASEAFAFGGGNVTSQTIKLQ